MFDLRAKRELHNGFGDALARGFEIAFTPVVFGLLGYGLDRWIGTQPLFTAVLAVLAVIGMFVKLWYGYDLEMRRHEAEGAWEKRP